MYMLIKSEQRRTNQQLHNARWCFHPLPSVYYVSCHKHSCSSSWFIIITFLITNKIRIILGRFDGLIWCIHITWCKLTIVRWSGALPVLWKIWMMLYHGYCIELMILYIIIMAPASLNNGIASSTASKHVSVLIAPSIVTHQLLIVSCCSANI